MRLSDENHKETPDESIISALKHQVTVKPLPFEKKADLSIRIEEFAAKDLRISKELELVEIGKGKNFGTLVNIKQRKTWAKRAPIVLSDISNKPEDKVIIVHNGSGTIFRLVFQPATQPRISYGKVPPSKKPTASIERNMPQISLLNSKPSSETSLESLYFDLTKSACQKAIDSRSNVIMQTLTDKISEIINSVFASYASAQIDLRKELDNKNKQIESLEFRIKDLNHKLRVTHNTALSQMRKDLESASLILRGYSTPGNVTPPGTMLHSLLESSQCSANELLKDEHMEALIDDINRMNSDLQQLTEIFAEKELMTPRKGEKHE